MNKIIEQFLKDLKIEKNRTDQTLENYRFYLNRFFQSTKINLPQEIDNQKIDKFCLWLENQKINQKNLSQATKNYHLIALRNFIKYLNKKNLNQYAWKKIKLNQTQKIPTDNLDLLDLQKLLDSPFRTQEKRIVQLRDKAILELLFCAGLKVSELALLKKSDLNLTRHDFLIKGKFEKPRAANLSNQAQFALKNYLTFRKDLSPFLFVRHDKANTTNQPKNLTPRSIQRLIKRYAKLAGIKTKVTPQTLRRAFAANLFQTGTEIESVKTVLGHVSINSTKLYDQPE